MAYSTDPYALKPEDVKRLGGSSFTKPFGPVPKQPGFTDPFSGGSRLVNQGFASPVSTVPHPGAFGQRPQPPFVDAFRSRPTAPPPPAAQPAQPNPAGAMPIGGAAAPGNPPPVESGSVTRATITPKTPAPATTRTGDVIAASPAVYAPVQTAKPAPMEVSAAATPAAQVKPAEMQVADQAAVNSIQVAKPAPMNVADQAAVNPVKTTEVKPAEPPAGEVTQPQNFDDSLAEFQKTAANWQAGIDDPIFRTAANRLITRLGLMNQADQDALQMQINQDPELRGQGAGRALLAMMSRDQNFKLDDMMGQLSEQSMQRVLDMQKYGFEAGLKINEARRSRGIEDANSLMAAGDFAGAASVLNKILGADMPGMGIKVDSKTLESRDPQALQEFESRMGVISKLAKTSPEAAAAAMTTLLSDPRFKSWFPEGVSAKDLIASITSDQVIEGIQKADTLGQAVNQMALAGRDFDAAEHAIEAYFTASGRDPISAGKKLTLAEINAVRTGDHLGEFKEENGVLVDDTGLPLDDQDFKELAYRKEYQDRVRKSQEAPWQPLMDIILKSNLGAKFTDTALFPNGRNSLEDYVQSLYLSHSYTTDPTTGLMVPNSQAPLPWNDPALYHQFYSWPTANWESDATGTRTGKYTGTPDPGGDAYGDTVGGARVVSTPEDEALDQKWITYQRGGGKLSAKEWYFASAGGALDPSRAGALDNIPANAKPAAGTGTTGTVASHVPSPADPDFTQQQAAFETEYKNYSNDQLTEKLKDQAFLNKAIGYGQVDNYTDVATIPTTAQEWTAMRTKNGGYAVINGIPLHIENNAVEHDNGKGRHTWTVPIKAPNGTVYSVVIWSDKAGWPVGTLLDSDNVHDSTQTVDWSTLSGAANA